MNQKLKFLIIFIVIVILSYFVAPYAGSWYEQIIGHGIGSWIGACPECFEGFALIFTFLSGLLLFSLFDKNRFKITLPFVLIFPILALIAGDGNAFLIDLAAGIIGMILGQLIFLIRKKVKK